MLEGESRGDASTPQLTSPHVSLFSAMTPPPTPSNHPRCFHRDGCHSSPPVSHFEVTPRREAQEPCRAQTDTLKLYSKTPADCYPWVPSDS
ncbi:hypothetical protein KUCAC02_032330, partial [Chaenocephalus aceratus]